MNDDSNHIILNVVCVLVLNENNVVKIPRRGYKLVKSLFGQYEEIPEEWDFSELGKHCTFFVPMRNKPKKFDGHIPWLRIEDLDGKFVSETKSGQYVTSNTVKEMKLRIYPIGTILCSCSATIGVCAITKRELITNQTFIGIFPNCRINNEYLYYYLSTQKNNLIKIGSGSTILYISRKKFEAFPINLPLIQEQQKIASILSGVDALVESTQKTIEKAERLKKGLMQKLLTLGTDHTKFKKTTLGGIATFSSGEFLPAKNHNSGSVPIYGGNGITGYHDKELIKYNTIIFGRVGAYCGSVHLSNSKSWITDNAIFIKNLSNQITIAYLYRFLSRLNIRLLAEISAQPKISQDILNHIKIHFPEDLKEQQKIASILSGVDAVRHHNIITSIILRIKFAIFLILCVWIGIVHTLVF